ncbi:MAG: L,D-transpeptidase [Gammaproteobacteria bacterium]|nr:MAG: L,D-transpeptidase [Gammaproteobacteria bacterium]
MLQLDISISEQLCRLSDSDSTVFEAQVSTALNGAGEQKNSGCTPCGLHYIRACIGAGQVENSVFVGRRPTGEVYNDALAAQYPQRDWILTRIMWLSGLELGKNRLANVDTMQRYIYIHGCPDSLPMGKALSHGCIRMYNKDLLTLFELVSPGTRVMIHE